MRYRIQSLIAALVVGSVVFLAGRQLGQAQQPQQPAESLLVIGKFQVAQGRPVSEAIAEASQTVRDLRATGEFNRVRLYIHSWGSDLAVYILHEPKSWQAIKTGYDKLFAARPDLMTAPFRWAGHSDDILTEIPIP
jgi:hypothetical protein